MEPKHLAIEIQNLKKSYKNLPVLTDVSLVV